jgi:chromosome segregation ATPase
MKWPEPHADGWNQPSQADLKTLNDTLTRTQQECTRLLEENRRLAANQRAGAESFEKLEKAYLEAKAEADRRTEELNKSCGRHIQKNTEIERLKNDNQKLTEEVRSRGKRIAELEARVVELKGIAGLNWAELKEDHKRLTACFWNDKLCSKEIFDVLQRQALRITELQQPAHAEIERLKGQLEAAEKHNQILQQANSEKDKYVCQLQDQLNKDEQEIRIQTTEMENRRLKSDRRAGAQQVDELTKRLELGIEIVARKDAEIERLTQDKLDYISAHQQEIEQLQQKLKVVSAQRDSTRQSRDKAWDRENGLIAVSECLQNELASLKAVEEDHRKLNGELRGEAERLRKENDKLLKDVEYLNRALFRVEENSRRERQELSNRFTLQVEMIRQQNAYLIKTIADASWLERLRHPLIVVKEPQKKS